MGIKIIDCIYEKGVFRPLEKVQLKDGERAKILLSEEREKILDRYCGIVKLGREVKLKEILDLEEDAWQY